MIRPLARWFAPVAIVASGLIYGVGLLWVPASTPIAGTAPAKGEKADHVTVYLSRFQYHAGVIVPLAELPKGVIPERIHFPNVRYLEFGWGERRFYMERENRVSTAVRALITPTPSVMHVVGFWREPQHYFLSVDLIAFELSRRDFDNLCGFIHAGFNRRGRSAETPLEPIGQGRYGTVSHFYEGNGQYYLPKTCNVWTAAALQAGGLRMDPFSKQHAAQLVAATRGQGTVLLETAASEGNDE